MLCRTTSFFTEPAPGLWGLNRIGAPAAWNTEHDANYLDESQNQVNVLVAVIDTGGKYDHEDLAGNMWANTGETAGNGIDDDNNGYIDDVQGFNATTIDWDSVEPGDKLIAGNPMDTGYHGTHVAGTIGAVGNNSIGVTGVSWQVKIVPCVNMIVDQGRTDWFTRDSVACIDYAIAVGADVINASWGGPPSNALRDAVKGANENKIMFIAAAGNSYFDTDIDPHYPASYDLRNIVSVMATDNEDKLAFWYTGGGSNWGYNSVDLAAPGKDILSCVPYFQTNPQHPLYGEYYEWLEGTSMAAPHVTGALALLKALHPTWNHLQLIQHILDNVEPVNSLVGRCRTGGILDLEAAFNDNDPPAELQLSPNAVHFAGRIGSIPLVSRTIRMANLSIQNFNWSVTSKPNWVDVTTTASQPVESGQEIELTITLNSAASSLTESQSGTIVITTNTNLSATCEVSLVIGSRLYVKADAQGSTHDGSSWQNALLTVREAADTACSGQEIWVAAGTYISPVILQSGIKLLGGFAGYESNEQEKNQRDIAANETIIEGDYSAGPVTICGGSTAGTTSVLEGFTLRHSPYTNIYDDYYLPVVMQSGYAEIRKNKIIGIEHEGACIYSQGHPTITENTIKESWLEGIFCAWLSSATIDRI